MDTSVEPTLIPAGYLIVQEFESLILSSEYRSMAPYYGVDRSPPFIAPDDIIRSALGVPRVTDAGLRAALEEWYECRPPSTGFIASEAQAIRLVQTFQSFGYRLELLYCQLTLKEGEEGRLSRYEKIEGPQPVVRRTFGFDVSWPTCNHSAIRQPGVVPNNPSWRPKLNQYGLLNNFIEALQLREEYLLIQPELPFDIFLVHEV
jgi:hypothetical protein